MEGERGSSTLILCRLCDKEFSSTSTRNRHVKQFHPEAEQPTQKKRIMCPLCPNEEVFSFHKDLLKHLTNCHHVNIIESVLYFRNVEEFTAWKELENRGVDYTFRVRNKCSNGEENILYNCNRSDSKGFVSLCQKRSMKTGGSIHIHGMCPSKINAKFLKDGKVMVKFIETHVGHEDELRTKRLSKNEQENIVGQLTAGVTNDRILQDARKIENKELKRINLITRGDLAYLIRKHNIDKRRHTDDMIATALKIEEWNQEGKNHAFLFKKIGDSYPGLKDEDFAVGFMNGIMDKKLRDFKRVICVDGTHGTNRRNWDLTTVLVKDENNMGFPVAFLLSNRLDQTIQEIFFRALQSRLGTSVEAEYIMSDDDIKYYNAWVKVMGAEKKPRRLLCTWHVIKNWNIQGRSKIKNEKVRQEMKKEMRKILKETNVNKFEELKEVYFKFLEKEGENDFLKYLQNYYFQNEERIMMWAHCYRVNAGINTNMAIESLNKLLKYNKMNGQRNIRVEKLLDLLDDIVDEKMWKKIVQTERPNSNNYQHKITLEAHKKATHMDGKVEISNCGNFKVQSGSENDKYYFVSYNELCNNDCRLGYCNKCKICLHRYNCDCPDNTIKSVLCKHIHAVALFEEKSEFVLGTACAEVSEDLCINEPSTSQLDYQKDVTHFIQESSSTQDHKTSPSFYETRQICISEMNNFSNTLDEQELKKLMAVFTKFKKEVMEERDQDGICKKRKIEKQTYYPNKK